MVVSEAEAETRLAALRREREALDRAITDLTLYLELGRRLAGASADQAGASWRGAARSAAPPSDRAAATAPPPEAARGVAHWAADGGLGASAAEPAGAAALAPGDPANTAGTIAASRAASRAAPRSAFSAGAGAAERRHALQDAKPAPETISEGALARRYGRALIREAVAVLEAAGRPLHASEILSSLTSRGFTIPGRQDPVAALNTRLWKRAAPGGPLRRLGDALYAPAQGAAADPGEG